MQMTWTKNDMLHRQLLDFMQTVVDPVIAHCRHWVQNRMTLCGCQVTSCETFGSHCYGLGLPTSDVDIAAILPWGSNDQVFLDKLRELANAEGSPFTDEGKCLITDCHQAEFRGLAVDIKPMNIRKYDFACQSTDRLKSLIEMRSNSESFKPKLQAIHIFKLVCHFLEITQHHWTARAGKFKAIALSYWAVAVCDTMEPDISAGKAINLLCHAFKEFDRMKWRVAVSAAGAVSICRKMMVE